MINVEKAARLTLSLIYFVNELRRLPETDWNHKLIISLFLTKSDQILYFTTLQNTSKTPENLDTKGQKVRIYFGTEKKEHNTIVKP